MLRLIASAAVLVNSVAAVKNVVWAGRAAGFNDADNWAGGFPGSKNPNEQPSYVSFGKVDGSITATAPAGTFVVGRKITLNGKVKLVLGDGSTKAKLSFSEGKGGDTKFLPGSDVELADNTKLQGFDFNCHMNWRQAEEPDVYVLKPPCESDKVYVVTSNDASGSGNFRAPAAYDETTSLFTSTFGVKSYFRRLYVQSEPGKASSISVDDCEDGNAITEGAFTVDLGVCSSRSGSNYDTYISASTNQADDECKSTCPPEGILDDGSILQAVKDKDGDIKYIQIGDDGVDTGATVETDEDGEGHTTFTVTDTDGNVQDHIKYNGAAAGSSIARKTTSTTTSTSTSTSSSTATTATATTATATTKTTVEDEIPDPQNDPNASKTPTKKSGGGNTTTIVIVVVVVLIVIIGAVAYVMKAGGGNNNAGQQGVVSFENPMYDSAQKQNPASEAAYAMPQGGAGQSSGYMDVPASGSGGYAEAGNGGGGGYMDVSPNTGGNSGGYMDVSPNTGGGGGTSGYMDVDAGGYGDSDEEDV